MKYTEKITAIWFICKKTFYFLWKTSAKCLLILLMCQIQKSFYTFRIQVIRRCRPVIPFTLSRYFLPEKKYLSFSGAYFLCLLTGLTFNKFCDCILLCTNHIYAQKPFIFIRNIFFSAAFHRQCSCCIVFWILLTYHSTGSSGRPFIFVIYPHFKIIFSCFIHTVFHIFQPFCGKIFRFQTFT